MAVTKNAKNVQTEVDASFLYRRLYEKETDAGMAAVFKQMSEIEQRHAEAMFKKYNPGSTVSLPAPSGRAKVIDMVGRILGYDYVLGTLMDTEKSISNAVLVHKKNRNISIEGNETNHVKILRSLLEQDKTYGANLARFEKRHRSVGGNALRAAVLGGNDGLVSNFSLVMGIAGASATQQSVLLAGIAGLLAGALSMALGEWISVKSSQELYENQMDIEMEELETNPEDEQHELALIYMAKGVAEPQAKQMAAEALADKNKAHQILIKEELGISPEELKGSAVEAAVFSFVLFSIGAIIPVIPFFFVSGMKAVMFSVGLSVLGLFFIGSAITLFTNKNVWFSGLRQVAFGLLAAAITFGIGRLIGVSLAG